MQSGCILFYPSIWCNSGEGRGRVLEIQEIVIANLNVSVYFILKLRNVNKIN